MHPEKNTTYLDLPTGEWKGFFLEKHHSKRGWMHLYLSFNEHSMSGEGTDYVGPWHISGTFDEKGNVSWSKQYLGKHQVNYEGNCSEKGIKGEWNINGFLNGTFHIWPKGMRDLDQLYLENEFDIDPGEIDPGELLRPHLNEEDNSIESGTIY